MKYLLLGGAGFVGIHLAKRLIKEGHEVTIVDALFTSSRPTIPCDFVLGDIRDVYLDSYIENADIIYFLAGSVGVEHIDKHPKETLDNNIGLMTKLIPLFDKYKKPVVFSSTSEVYGEGPFVEDATLHIGPPTKLRWGYACAKLMTEFSIASADFPYVIVRFFNVVGPGQLPNYGMVLPRMINAAKNNEDIIVYGSGNQVRSFCHVTDAIEYLRRIETCYGEIFNLGSENPITINQLAAKVISLTNSNSKIVHVPYEKAFSKNHGDINNRVPDLTKLKYITGYVAHYDLDAIIIDTL